MSRHNLHFDAESVDGVIHALKFMAISISTVVDSHQKLNRVVQKEI